MKLVSTLGVAVVTAVLCAAPITVHWSPSSTPSLSVSAADARVGRPLTPMSVAGVNRRVNRELTTVPRRPAQPQSAQAFTTIVAPVATLRIRRATDPRLVLT